LGHHAEPSGGTDFISAPGIATTARVVVIALAMTAFAYFAKPVVVPVLFAWVASLALKPLVRWLGVLRIPTSLSAALIVTTVVTGAGLGTVYLVRPAAAWLEEAPENMDRVKEKFRAVLRPAARLSEAASSVGTLGTEDGAPKVPAIEVNDHRMASSLFTWTGSLMTGIGEAIAMLFLLLASGDLLLQKVVRVTPRLRGKKQAIAISREIQQTISMYLFSVGLINLAFGVVVGASLHLVGMPNAVMWGGVAALLNFVPYIGPIVGIGLIGVAGLLAFDSLEVGLIPAGVYLMLHLVEANAVTPLVLGRRFALNPVVIFLALIFCTWLWGPLGALLAMPLLMTVKVIGDRIPELSPFAEFLAPHNVVESAVQAATPSLQAAGPVPEADLGPSQSRL
jgi:predicted PurR-regulated permease PerM